jgi:hypothetical protein
LIIGGITVVGLALIIAALSWPTANSLDLQNAPTQNNEDAQVVNSDTMIENFQAGHGFFNQVTVGGLQTDDNDDYTLGEQSLRLTTNGDGSAIFTRKANISPQIDLDNKLLKVWVKVSDTSKLDELRITVTSDRFETHRNYWLYGPNQLSTPLEDNEWTILTIEPEGIEDVGSPDLSRIDTIQLRLADNGAGPVSVWFNGIELIEEEDSQS